MTTYWITIALVGYLIWMAKLAEPAMNEHQMGTLPTKPLTRMFVLLAALVLIFVAALRWNVGTDYSQYFTNYNSYKFSFFNDLRSFNEPGIRGIAWLVSKVADSSALFMATVSIICIGLMLLTITRYSIAIPMSYLLFVFVGSWAGSFNGLRQFLAAAILFAGHRYLISRRPIHYLGVVALASSFHISALAFLLLYLLPNKRMRPSTLLLLICISAILLYSSDFIITLLASRNSSNSIPDYFTRNINPLRISVAILPTLLYFTSSTRTEEDGEWFYRNMAIMHGVVMFAATFSAYLGRFGIYTVVFLPLTLPRLIDFPDRALTHLLRGLTIILFMIFWIIEISGSSSLNNYQFIFNQDH